MRRPEIENPSWWFAGIAIALLIAATLLITYG